MPLPSAGPADCSSGLSARIFNNFRYDNPWQASQSGVAVGTLTCPTTPNGFGYRCSAITTGITGGSEPTWPIVLTNTVIDGGVTWTCQDVANPTGKAHPPAGYFGYVFSSNDLDGFRLLAYNQAKAICDELAADNESWTAFTFNGTWANAAGRMACAYFKDFTGRVWLRGTATGGAAGSITTLPAGYRPSAVVVALTDHNAAAGNVSVDTAGVVFTNWPGAVFTNICLDGISFDTR